MTHARGIHTMYRHRSHHGMRKTQKWLLAGMTVLFLMAGTAALASYMTHKQAQDASRNTQAAPSSSLASKPAASPAEHKVASMQPECNDKNILGYLAGGALGGILGSQVGKGSGKTAATIAGVAGGAYAGGKYLPTRNATCQ